MSMQRRDFLMKSFFGGGLIGLRALATGLPISLLLERKARADEMCVPDPNTQYLIIATSGAGDPVNCNVPGTYDYDDIIHAMDPSMAPTMFNLGSTPVKAAQIWSTLPQWVLDRTCFFHHATFTNSHPNHTKVLRLMGQTANNEYVPSIFARALAPCFRTVQTEPVSVGAGSILSFQGRALPNLKPSALKSVLGHPTSPLVQLQDLRDQTMDSLHAALKQNGSAAQKAFIDEMAQSRAQARSLSDSLLSALDNLRGDGSDSEVTAAVTLIRMNVAPVYAINIAFGGDNHTDQDLMKSEVPQHATGIQRITQLMTELQAAGLQDKVTFMMLNVFGRTLKNQGYAGRTHWANHHCAVLIGKNVRPGIIGGLIPQGNDYQASPIDSASGRASMSGDISFNESLGSMAKTVGRAIGVPQSVLDQNILSGKVVPAAIGAASA
jgi:uncharacterized protein DUF1501